MKIFLANPRGFCAGVNRAIAIVEKALNIFGTPIYVHHDIVHNKYVVNSFQKKGVIFIEDLNIIPKNSIVIFSAHGVSKKIRERAIKKNFFILLDATCPLVNKIHKKVINASKKKIETIFIGHSGHPEVEGTLGQYENRNNIHLIETEKDAWNVNIKNKKKICFVTQTTLSRENTRNIMKILNRKFPYIIKNKNDICYATTNRQQAILNLAKKVDMILVVGSKHSSNANRLFEIANKKTMFPSFLIESEKEIRSSWFHNIKNIGISSGASTPEILVQNVIQKLSHLGGKNPIEMNGLKEKEFFKIPKKIAEGRI